MLNELLYNVTTIFWFGDCTQKDKRPNKLRNLQESLRNMFLNVCTEPQLLITMF